MINQNHNDVFDNEAIQRLALSEVSDDYLILEDITPHDAYYQNEVASFFDTHLEKYLLQHTEEKVLRTLCLRFGLLGEEEHSCAEIADKIGVGKQHVYTLLHKGLRFTNRLLSQQGFEDGLSLGTDTNDTRSSLSSFLTEINFSHCKQPASACFGDDVIFRHYQTRALYEEFSKQGKEFRSNSLELERICREGRYLALTTDISIITFKTDNPYRRNTIEAAFWALGVLGMNYLFSGTSVRAQANTLLSFGHYH